MKLEDANHFEIGGSVDEGDADISLTCLRCPDGHEWLKVGTDEDGPGVRLADLIRRAEQHAESCPAAARLAAEPSRFPAQCTRELDVEPTGAPDEDVCLGDVDPGSGRCRTCGADYARLAAGTEEG